MNKSPFPENDHNGVYLQGQIRLARFRAEKLDFQILLHVLHVSVLFEKIQNLQLGTRVVKLFNFLRLKQGGGIKKELSTTWT